MIIQIHIHSSRKILSKYGENILFYLKKMKFGIMLMLKQIYVVDFNYVFFREMFQEEELGLFIYYQVNDVIFNRKNYNSGVYFLNSYSWYFFAAPG